MFFQSHPKQKEIKFERTYDAPIEQVWKAWTDPTIIKQWWGPENTTVPECEIDLRIGGVVRIVMEAGEAMGKYAGTRWPLEGTFTVVEAPTKLAYQAKSWTENEKKSSEIDQVNELTLSTEGSKTKMELLVTINKTGPAAIMASMGLRMGYKAQFEKLATLLSK